MPATCDRHPTQPAWWQCPQCHKSLCPNCISRRIGGTFNQETFYFCPTCNTQTQNLELSNVIPPIWGRLHKFFVYPLSSWQSFGLILSLSLIAVLLSQPGIISTLIRFALWAIMVKYSFEALKATSSGHLQPPGLTEKVLVDNFGIVFKQIALYFALFTLFLLVVVKTGPLMMAVCIILGAVTLPAMLILMIINNDLGKALNPVMVIGLIVRIGGHYFLLLFFLLLLTGAPTALGFAFIRHFPEPLQIFMITLANNYYTLIAYHMMGYIILQFHHRLDYPVELETVLASMHTASGPSDQTTARPVVISQNEGLLNEISLLIQEGDLDKAINQIEHQVQTEEIDDYALSKQYIGLLIMRRQDLKLLAYASHHLELEIKSGTKEKTMEIYTRCLRLDKTFTPSPLVLFKIAGWLNDSAKSKEAIQTINRLIKKYPQDALVPKALYRAALIFHERLMDAQKAKNILAGLIRKFPDHDMAGFARRYLKGL